MQKTKVVFWIMIILLSLDTLTTVLIFNSDIGYECNMVIRQLYQIGQYWILLWFVVVGLFLSVFGRIMDYYCMTTEYRAILIMYSLALFVSVINNTWVWLM